MIISWFTIRARNALITDLSNCNLYVHVSTIQSIYNHTEVIIIII